MCGGSSYLLRNRLGSGLAGLLRAGRITGSLTTPAVATKLAPALPSPCCTRAQHLPPFLGGTAEPRPIQDACAQLLPRWAAERDVAERAAGLCGGAAAAPAGSGEGLEEGDDDDEAEFFDTASEDEGEERCAASGAGAAAGRPE